MEAFGFTHPGLVRETNEDALAVAPCVGFFAVADGVGGNAAGEVASRMAINSVVGAVEDAAVLAPQALGVSLLADAVREANAWVLRAASRDPAKAGMGTTFTGLLVVNDRAIVAHVGDSRAYLLRGRQLRQLTEDHSLVNARIQAGTMTREEAATSEVRNVILRAVGVEEAIEVDTRLVAIEPGDTILLATDGLHGVVEDEEIARVLLNERDVTRAVMKLIERANDRGGPDNITAVLVRIG